MIVTFFDSLGCATKHEHETSWEAVRGAIDNPTYYPSKKQLPLIKLAEFGQIRSDKGSLKTDDNVVYVWGIEGDYDGGIVQPYQASFILQQAGITASIHTSPSSTETAPRWRVLCPLSEARYPIERKELMGKLNAVLGGILANESFTVSQGFFFGAVTGTVGYKAFHSDGKCIDQIPGITPLYPLGITDKQPVISTPVTELTTQQYNDLRMALVFISTDEYNERIAVGQALSCLGDTGLILWEEWLASAGREFANETHSKWDTFTAARTSYQSVFSKASARGWENPAIKKPTDPRLIQWAKSVPAELGGVGPGESGFSKYVTWDIIDQLKKRAVDEKFIMGNLALQGEITVIYAKPMTGKTLLTQKLLFESLDSGGIEKGNIYYVNADDSLNGYIGKTIIAKKHGCNVVVPNERGFKADQFLKIIEQDVLNDACRGKVIVLDTLKKFCNLMDKASGANFVNSLRPYAQAGGTVIMLGHTNKRKNESGETMHAGTSDVPEDGDCAYILEELKMNGERRHVVFKNFKSRGNHWQEAEYSYKFTDVSGYQERLDSVKFEGSGQKGERSDDKKGDVVNVSILENDIIDCIELAIKQNIIIKKHLINYVKNEMDGVSFLKARQVIDKFTGSDYNVGHRWNYQLSEDNVSKQYFLLPPF